MASVRIGSADGASIDDIIIMRWLISFGCFFN